MVIHSNWKIVVITSTTMAITSAIIHTGPESGFNIYHN